MWGWCCGKGMEAENSWLKRENFIERARILTYWYGCMMFMMIRCKCYSFIAFHTHQSLRSSSELSTWGKKKMCVFSVHSKSIKIQLVLAISMLVGMLLIKIFLPLALKYKSTILIKFKSHHVKCTFHLNKGNHFFFV